MLPKKDATPLRPGRFAGMLRLIVVFLLVFCFSALVTTLLNREHVKAKSSKRKTARSDQQAEPAATATATPAPSPSPTPSPAPAAAQATPTATGNASAQTSNKKDKKGKKGETTGAGLKTDPKAAEPPDMSTLFSDTHSVLSMTELRCQVHREGEIRQDVSSRAGRFDEDAGVMDLDVLNIKFQDKGTSVGTLLCGTGRLWTKNRPKEGITANDMLLRKDVRLQTKDRMLLQSPEMVYRAAETVLSSDKGYQEQMPAGDHYVIGNGRRFEIKLRLKENNFEYWRMYGNPAVLKKSDKPVLLP